MTAKALLGQVSDVDMRLLRVFGAVVRCGGISAAELELNIGRSTISRHLGNNLQNNKDSNVTFVCKGGDVISWNGLPLLASLTWFFDVDCCSCQTEATLLLPDHSADAVRAVLLLISRGSAEIGAGEMGETMDLMKTMVRKKKWLSFP